VTEPMLTIEGGYFPTHQPRKSQSQRRIVRCVDEIEEPPARQLIWFIAQQVGAGRVGMNDGAASIDNQNAKRQLVEDTHFLCPGIAHPLVLAVGRKCRAWRYHATTIWQFR
jgi:hypothetical protein